MSLGDLERRMDLAHISYTDSTYPELQNSKKIFVHSTIQTGVTDN